MKSIKSFLSANLPLSIAHLVFGICCAALFAGCGDTDCYVVSADAKGIQKDAPIVWQDAYVGKVSAVEQMPSGSRVSLGIKGEFAEKIHAGVVARIVLDENIGATPFVLLVGGKDPAMPVLADGARISEAAPPTVASVGGGFVDWLKESSHTGEKAGGGIIIILLLVLRFVKKLVKMLIKLLILAVLVLTLLVAKQDWSAYRARFDSVKESFQSVQSWVTDHSDALKKIVNQAVPANGK